MLLFKIITKKISTTLKIFFSDLPSYSFPLIGDLVRRLPPIRVTNYSRKYKILVQCVYDPYFLSLFSTIVSALSNSIPLKVQLFIPASVNSSIGISPISYFLRSAFPNLLVARQWIRAYSEFSDEVGYRSVSFEFPFEDAICWLRSLVLWLTLRNSNDVENIQIEGISCGDLIIDTYLRFFPSPCLEIGNFFLFYVIWQAHRDIFRSRRYFIQQKPELYLTSYTTYIQHGIAVRVALMLGVPTISLSSLQLLSPCYPFHSKNPTNYRAQFLDRTDQRQLLLSAKNKLECRLNGGIDSATFYMNETAYSTKRLSDIDLSNSVVIFLHDFFDSPHIYQSRMLFPDFWSWACFTIETLAESGISFYIKPHPNQISLSSSVIKSLIAKYPNVNMLPARISNRQLVDNELRCGITMYGTIAHELAYLGVPSIACGIHPHVSFDFCKTASSLQEYSHLLKNSLAICYENLADVKLQVLQFYTMHYLNSSDSMLQMQDSLIELSAILQESEKSCTMDTIDQIINKLENIRAGNGFAEFLTNILRALGDE